MLALCLFLVVGVPVLVLVTTPGVRADDTWSPPSDAVPGEAGSDPAGGDQPGLQPDPQEPSTPTSDAALADATAAAEQVLTVTPPQPVADPRSDQHGSGGLPQTTPNLTLLLGPDPSRSRQPTPPSDHDGTGYGDSDGDVPLSGLGDQAPRPTLRLDLALDDQQAPEATRPDPTSTSARVDQAPIPTTLEQEQVEPSGPATRPGQATDPTGVIIALGDPTRLQAADASLLAIDRLRIPPDPAALGPGKQVLLVRLGSLVPLAEGADTPPQLPWAQPGPRYRPVLLLDPAALETVPAAAAGIAGWGPVTVSPTPTAADSLDAFLHTVWERRQGIYEGPRTVYSLFANHAAGRSYPLWGPEAYNLAVRAMSPSGRPLMFQLEFTTPPDSTGERGMDLLHRFTREPAEVGARPADGRLQLLVDESPRPQNAPYRLWVNALPDDAPTVMDRLLREFVQGPQAGVPEASLAMSQDIQTRRNGIQVAIADLQTLEQVALRINRLPIELVWSDPVPMADPLLPGISMGVELPGHASFGAERATAIDLALRDAPPNDFEAFRQLAHERLRAAGVSPNAPHTQYDSYTQTDVQMFSPERRIWLQAEGSATDGYHLGGIRSPAATSSGLGAGLGLLLSGGSILRNPQGHPHAVSELATAAGAGVAGGYLGGQVEFGLNAALAPAELTWTNASFASGLRGMILPRTLSGGVAGAVTAPLMAWTLMGIDQWYYGADYRGSDYAAAGARSATGGAAGGSVGAGTAALSIYLLGGAATGSSVPILGSLAGAGTGLVVYFVVDSLWGENIEQAVRTALGEQRPLGRATAK
ncbi:MAG TPA: T3SS effector HopA1 family protein [Actinomycetes bacterium]|nr:T3SS effector HopA1 family protein [Actinomycetes bacterium]